MIKRISHKKSRKGCASCKRRHIKCDEAGPPCTNCKHRGLACVYNVITKGTNSSSSTPLVDTLSVEEHRLLELELMHRWSVSTYMSICSTKEDEHLMQVILPRKGIQHPFVMDSIIALAALHIASCPDQDNVRAVADAASLGTGSTASHDDTIITTTTITETAKYLRIALEYSERASSGFRANLLDVNADNISLLYVCSGLVLIINMGMPHCLGAHGYCLEGGVLANVADMFNLLNGMVAIAMSDYDQLLASDFAPSAHAVMELGSADLDEWLAPEMVAALALLDAINDRNSLLHSFVGEGAPEVNNDDVDLDATNRNPTHAEYKAIVQYLRVCFAEDARDAIRGFCLSLPSYSGPAFARAVAEREPMALYVLLYWAVLVEAMTRVKEAWWARDVGKRVVDEISGLLPVSELYKGLEEGKEAMVWVIMQFDSGMDVPDLGIDMDTREEEVFRGIWKPGLP